jgi:hypothetical protein
MIMDNNTFNPLNTFDTLALLSALQQKNLVYNYNFLYFSNKTTASSGVVDYQHPDGWVYNDSGSGAQISLYEQHCRIVTSNDSSSLMTFRQSLNEFPRWEQTIPGQHVSARTVMTLSKNSQVSVTLSDGINSNTVTSTSDGDIKLNLNLQVANSATELYIEVQSISNSAVIDISKIYANIGTVAVENLPCVVSGVIGQRKQYVATENPPAEELSLCNEAREVGSNQTRLDSVLNQRFGKGSNNMSLLPDMRGYFSRSWDNGAGVDTDASTREMLGNNQLKGDYVGTSEKDAFLQHQHKLSFSNMSIMQETAGPATGLNTAVTSNTKASGGTETRSKNIAELYTIKWA